MSIATQASNRTLIALISDEDTATGLLLAGIGHISSGSGGVTAHKSGDGARQHEAATGNASGNAGLIGESDRTTQIASECLERNFFIVTSQTGVAEIEAAFRAYTEEREDIAIVLITQPLAEKIRQICDRYTQAFPALLEIPSKDAPYDPSKDSILKRVQKLFGE